MTNGIIQEVIDEWIYQDRTGIEDLKKELIKKIKEEFQYCKPLLSLDKYTTLQKRLIGDSNE